MCVCVCARACMCVCVKRRVGISRVNKLEDLKVLRRSPHLFNNVKIGEGQLQLIMKHILFYQPFWPSDLSNIMNNPSVISVKKMFR